MLGTLDPHSSFFSPKEYAQMRERQEGRYYGIGISIVSALDGDITAMARVRGIARATRRAFAAATSSRGSPARTPEGWTTEQAMREAARPEGHDGRRSASSGAATIELIPFDVDARRGHHSDRPGVFHDRRRRPATSACRTSARTPIATSKHALRRAVVEGDEAPAVRHPRQSRRSARPGDQGGERVPAEGHG